MSKTPQVTREYSESRRISSPILQEAREKLVSQHRLVKSIRYSWNGKPIEEETLDVSHFKTLISNKYSELRGLYAIPIHFDEFEAFVYRHPTIYRWSRYGYWAELHNSRIGSRYNRRRWRRRDDQSTGRYYRYGESFLQTGHKPKEEPVSDQYQVNPAQARKDWREHKQFRRDKAKGTCFCKCPLNDARYRRRYERDLIKKGQWDDIHTDKNQFTDAWDCC